MFVCFEAVFRVGIGFVSRMSETIGDVVAVFGFRVVRRQWIGSHSAFLRGAPVLNIADALRFRETPAANEDS